MEFKNTLIEKKNDLHEFLTNPKTVKWSIIGILVTLIPSLIIGILVAQLYVPYNIVANYISDLGSYNYTPIPKFLDYSLMITGILLIPIALYLLKLITDASEDAKEKGMLILGRIAIILFFVGIFAIFSLGFISEDVGFHLKGTITAGVDLHDLFTVTLFPFVGFAGIFIGIIAILYPKRVLEIFELNASKALSIALGIIMIVLPQLMVTFFVINELAPTMIIPPSSPFYEWMYLFSLLAWLIPLALIILRLVNKKLASP